MRWTHKHTCIGMLAVAAAILAVAAMNPVNTTPNEFGEIGSGVSTEPSSDYAPTPSTTRPVITLGDLDPPPHPTPALPPPWGPLRPAHGQPHGRSTPTTRLSTTDAPVGDRCLAGKEAVYLQDVARTRSRRCTEAGNASSSLTHLWRREHGDLSVGSHRGVRGDTIPAAPTRVGP